MVRIRCGAPKRSTLCTTKRGRSSEEDEAENGNGNGNGNGAAPDSSSSNGNKRLRINEGNEQVRELSPEERKDLKRQLRKKDLDVIATNKKVIASIEPFPKGTLEKFEEFNIWGKVLDYCKDDPEDYTNLYLADSIFRKHLGEVPLEILTTCFKLMKSTGALTFSEKKDRGPLLNVRLVSKRWKHVFDTEYFGSPFNDTKWRESRNFLEWKPSRAELHYFKTEQNMDRAIQMLRPGVDLQFFRNVFIDASENDKKSDEERQRYRQKVIQFSTLLGTSVWSLVYLGVWTNDTQREIMSRMPNLKSVCTKESR